MTTRAEEIAAEGPYRADWENGMSVVRDMNAPEGNKIMMMMPDNMEWFADRMNEAHANGYKRGQQDRWISVEERLPEPNIEVLVAFADDTVAGTSQWCRVKSPDIMGWLGPAENKGKTITHWMPLPSPPNPEQR